MSSRWQLKAGYQVVVVVVAVVVDAAAAVVVIIQHYNPLSLALASRATDAHSILSKTLVFHLFTPIYLQSNSTSPIHLNLGLYPWDKQPYVNL
jgi:hypothetical protein